MTSLQSLLRADGRTHAARVIAVVRSREAESFTVTRALVPSKFSAPPNVPSGVHVAVPIEPVLPLPEASLAVGPLPSSKE
jgi:hypothetical protein